MKKKAVVIPLAEVIKELKRPKSWLWRHTPYPGRVIWHGLGYAIRGDWFEARHNLRELRSHIMWYLRAVYAPYNALKVRNVTRKYSCDHDMYLLHAAFSVLCRHVERSLGGHQNLADSISSRRVEAADIKTDVFTKENLIVWADAQEKMLLLYLWYTRINWKEPIPYRDDGTWAEEDDRFYTEVCDSKLLELMSVRHFMWS